MHVHPHEAAAILPSVQCFFGLLVARYDEGRYPQDTYGGLLQQFANPQNIGLAQIESALRWKYARPHPQPLTGAHQQTINRLAGRWHYLLETQEHEYQIEALVDPDQPATDFVSRAFLVHLISPNDVPIIDRFNHRAVRWFIGMVRPSFPLGGLPQRYEDIVLVDCFMHQLLRVWGQDAPPLTSLDRYLMMFGKHVAPPYGG